MKEETNITQNLKSKLTENIRILKNIQRLLGDVISIQMYRK